MNAPVKTSTLKDYHERLLPVLVHIQDHLDEPLKLEDLAARAHFSPFHFHRVFRGMIGESLKQHIKRLRLERAAVQLKTTGHSITAIAFDAGYETHESFTRAFRGAFAASPTEYRELRVAERGCVQMLHTGPYEDEETTITAMKELAESQDFEFHGLHHEIYLSDPRRVPPEKLRTILRQPVRPMTTR